MSGSDLAALVARIVGMFLRIQNPREIQDHGTVLVYYTDSSDRLNIQTQDIGFPTIET